MATIVDAIGIAIGLDAKGVQQGMKQAQGAISSGLKSITSMLGPLATAFGIKSAMDTFTKTADELGKTADRIGVNIKDLDAWGMAAQHAGGSSEAFQASLESLNSGIQQLATQGTGRMKAPLEALGISAVDAAGKAKEPIAVMKELAAVAGSMDAAQFAGIASKLGLDKGTIALLQQGDVEVEKLVKSMEKFAYTKKDAQVAADYNDAMQDLGRAFQKVAATVLRVLVPAFTWLAEKFTAVVGVLGDNTATVVAAFGGMAMVIASKVLPAFKNMDAVWMKSKSLMTISAIAAAIGGLYLVLDDFLTYCRGGDSALAELWSVFGTGEEITQTLSEAWQEIKETGTELFATLVEGATKFFGYFRGAVDPLLDVFKNLFKTIKAIVQGDTDGIISGLGGLAQALLNLVVSLVSGAVSLLWDLLGQVYKLITTVFGQAWDWVKEKAISIFTSVFDFITGLFSRIGSAIGGVVKGIVAKLPDFILPDSVKEWANSVDETAANAEPGTPESGLARPISESSAASPPSYPPGDPRSGLKTEIQPQGGTGWAPPPYVMPTAADAARPVETNTTNNVDSHSETTVNVGGISVTTQATDAQGTANATVDAFKGKVAGVANGAVQVG